MNTSNFADSILTDFPRLDGERDDSPRFMRAIAASPNGILAVPKGEYEIATPLTVTNHCSLEMHPAAHLKAVAKMDFILTWDGNSDYHSLSVFDENGELDDNMGLFIRGGDIDGNGLASCLRIGNSHHFTLANIVLHNGVQAGLAVTRWNNGHLYELIATNVYCKCNMPGLAGNVGVDLGVSDCHLTDIIVVDYTVGIRSSGGANRLTRCHVWGGVVPPKGMSVKEWSSFYGANKKKRFSGNWTDADEQALLSKGLPEMLADSIAFDIRGGNDILDGCYADTAEIGYNIHNGTTIISSGFFNNPLMGLRKSTALVHHGGILKVSYCDFRGAADCEKLYEGDGKNLIWIASSASGGDGMEEELKDLLSAK